MTRIRGGCRRSEVLMPQPYCCRGARRSAGTAYGRCDLRRTGSSAPPGTACRVKGLSRETAWFSPRGSDDHPDRLPPRPRPDRPRRNAHVARRPRGRPRAGRQRRLEVRAHAAVHGAGAARPDLWPPRADRRRGPVQPVRRPGARHGRGHPAVLLGLLRRDVPAAREGSTSTAPTATRSSTPSPRPRTPTATPATCAGTSRSGSSPATARCSPGSRRRPTPRHPRSSRRSPARSARARSRRRPRGAGP